MEGGGGFGIGPAQDSPTRKLRDNTDCIGLVEQNLSTARYAIHRQIGGRIIQENEIKLAHTLEENSALQKTLAKRLDEKDKIQYKYIQHSFVYVI